MKAEQTRGKEGKNTKKMEIGKWSDSKNKSRIQSKGNRKIGK
jgi:hypothetical protein